MFRTAILTLCLALTASSTERLPNIQKIYAEYNTEYFDDTLPRNALIDWNEPGDNFMASTETLSDGRYHVAFNRDYSSAERVARLIMLHEQCHIKTDQHMLLEDAHSRAWRTCMLDLDRQGAFRRILIDFYEGN